MLLACLLCLVLAATLSGSAGYTGLVGILFAGLMVGCCVLPMLLMLFGRGREGGHSCHGGTAKEGEGTPRPRNNDTAAS